MRYTRFYGYFLLDASSPGSIRYVGWSRDPFKRFREHLRDARTNPHKARWLRRARPMLCLAAVRGTAAEIKQWEIETITTLRARGFRLVNLTTGGDGHTGPHSEKARQKMSRAQRAIMADPVRRAQKLARYRATEAETLARELARLDMEHGRRSG